MTEERLTLVARDHHKPELDWNNRRSGSRRSVAFVPSAALLGDALIAGLEMGFDIGRVIVDRADAADQFLDLLAELPGEYTGDALLIRDDGSGVLSATGRGGGREVHALTPHDVRFYLEAHDLVTSRVAIELTA